MNKPSNKTVIQERRKYKRRNLSYYLPIVDSNTEQVIGHLVDISRVGIMIDCKKSIPSGQNFDLRLDLMENVGDKASVEFVAQCKWCRSDKVQPYLYNAGFAIINISEADAEIIQKIADKYGTVER